MTGKARHALCRKPGGSARSWRAAYPCPSTQPPSRWTPTRAARRSAATPDMPHGIGEPFVPGPPPARASAAVSPMASRMPSWPTGTAKAVRFGIGAMTARADNQRFGESGPLRVAGCGGLRLCGCRAWIGHGPSIFLCPQGEKLCRVRRHPLGCVRFGPVAARCKPRFTEGEAPAVRTAPGRFAPAPLPSSGLAPSACARPQETAPEGADAGTTPAGPPGSRKGSRS